MSKAMLRAFSAAVIVLFAAVLAQAQAPEAAATSPMVEVTGSHPDVRHEYRLLATNKTSTMEKELNEAAEAGFHFQSAMGGETGFGGHEVVLIMSRTVGSHEKERYEYKLLATQKTSTMEKELQRAGDNGFEYKGQTIFDTAFGGKEVVVILERDHEKPLEKSQYKLLATSKTSTMQKELAESAGQGFELMGMTVAKTAFGGSEVVSILRRGTHGSVKALAEK